MLALDTPAPPPRLRTRLAIVGIALAVGAILNCLPEPASIAYILWMALAIPVLGVLAIVSAFQAVSEWGRARNAHATARGWQLALAVGAIVVMPMLGDIHDLLEVARLRSRLHAEAWEHPDRAGPHIAVVQSDEFLWSVSGYLYDDSGEIEKKCGTQSELWLQRAGEARLGRLDYCAASISHVIGPYYSWAQES